MIGDFIKNIKIGNKIIGDECSTFIIAEAGINHNGKIEIAKKMIDVAKDCCVDAIKFQTFKSNEFISSNEEQTCIYYSQNKKITEQAYNMFKRYEFSDKDWTEIINYCAKKNIIFLSTPQNKSDLDFLLDITDLPAIKVGSDDLTNLPLLKYFALKNLPMIVSSGMATLGEIEDAINCIKNTGNNKLIITHCISSYPTIVDEINLRKMITIKNAFKIIVGFSDHTQGIIASIGAVALGACVIEKHFTLDKKFHGPDHWFSADPNEMKELVNKIRYIEKALGTYIVKPTPKEKEMKKLVRRSIIALNGISKGVIITKDMIEYKRPGTGLSSKFEKYIIGKKAKINIKIDEQITLDKIE